MGTFTGKYRGSLWLLTDLYQLTMAYAYWKAGKAGREAVFQLAFRRNPFHGGFAVACGLDSVLDLIENFRPSSDDVEYLESLRSPSGSVTFEADFLDYLREMEFACDIDAIPEGTVAFPHEPLLRVCGPVLQCQLLESAVSNVLNFQTLIATKSARVCLAAQGDPVIEFGLRRAQGVDGGISASRAAYVGGCESTSNVMAGKLYGIPIRGTHAHSSVMLFDEEEAAFEAIAAVLPDQALLLVDTYDSLAGTRKAVEVGRRLRARGHELAGIRLDSGDLAYLSAECRRILDAGGFPGARIVASNELDEHVIASLKQQGARIDAWGVGTRLVTGYGDPALTGVYKLTAVRATGGDWRYKVKVSDQAGKSTIPGILQVRRYERDGEFIADAIYDTTLGIPTSCTIVDPADVTRQKSLSEWLPYTELLVPVFRGGERVYDSPPLDEIRRRTSVQLDRLHPGIKRFIHPHAYPAGLERSLYELRIRLILEARTGLRLAAEPDGPHEHA